MSCCNSKTQDGLDSTSSATGTFTASSFSTGGPSFTYTEEPLNLVLTSDGTTNITSSFQESYYTKIGNHVLVNFAIVISITDNTTPGVIRLQGFPHGPALSYGACTLAQLFGTIAPATSWPIQGFMIDGEMTFYAAQSQTPIETDLTQDGQAIVGNIAYNYSQPDL